MEHFGISAVQIGMIDEAEIAFNKSISLEPNYVETYNNLGNVLREKNVRAIYHGI